MPKKTDRNYESIIKRINTPTSPVPVRFVIMRNIIIVNLIGSSLLLMFNYMSEEKRLALVVVAGISLGVVYYYMKLLYVGSIYLHSMDGSWYSVWRKESGLMIMLACSGAVFLTYFIISLQVVYISLFEELNSMYCSIILWVFAVTPLSLVILVSLSPVFAQLVCHILSSFPIPLSYRGLSTADEKKIN